MLEKCADGEGRMGLFCAALKAIVRAKDIGPLSKCTVLSMPAKKYGVVGAFWVDTPM